MTRERQFVRRLLPLGAFQRDHPVDEVVVPGAGGDADHDPVESTVPLVIAERLPPDSVDDRRADSPVIAQLTEATLMDHLRRRRE